MNVQTCLNCGMSLDRQTRRCPKCDNQLDQQTDGSTITVDIAHHGERVHEALNKIHDLIEDTKQGVSQHIRFVVGSGIIREEAMMTLDNLKRRREIIHWQFESGNKGAILVKLKS